MSTLIPALVSTRDKVVQEDAPDVLKLCLMTHARDQVEVLRLDFSIERVFRDAVSNIFAVPTFTYTSSSIS